MIRRRAWALAAAGAATCMAAYAVTAEDYKNGVAPCMRVRAYECAETNWVNYLRLRPNDSHALASLGIVMNLRDNHAGAVAQFEKAIDLGEGSYELFAYYADSLTKLGKMDEAIDWSYKSLAVMPQLVDVRGKLAKLLASRKRYYEALAVLAAYDADVQGRGRPAYFEGQRIAIETALARQAGDASPTERPSLRAAKYGDHFYAPVSVGSGRPAVFVVDTGAARTTVSEDFLATSKVDYKVTMPSLTMVTADGRRLTARGVTVASLKVGPFELKQAPVIVCKGCVLLLGQSALSKFDLKSAKTQGVEFLTLSPRGL